MAERSVDDVYGALGGEAAHALLAKALTDGLDSIENPPPALVELFDKFETVRPGSGSTPRNPARC
ncbi:hypothetical protein RD149_15035 [Gordonia westfalica]|uniref:Uncharacterized protein n=1 Tax=Gordonia westfalica TaxID=158898 RepID=A0ABU2GUE4_9ACTN|nr:hypothetical protein [Gordonia westfalica]MDS1115078.1 hypothetical protein [Gordonia westfalica]